MDNYSILQADSSGYSANDMCDSPAKDLGWIEPGVIYTAVMDKWVIDIDVTRDSIGKKKLRNQKYSV